MISRRRPPLAFLILAIAAATALALPALATAATPVWGATVGLGAPSDEPVQPAVATASPRHAVAVWSAAVPGGFAVLARERRGLGAAWRPAVRLSPVVRLRPASPRAAVNARGDAVVVWRLHTGAVQAATRRGPAGAWTRRAVSAGGGSRLGGGAAAVGIDGSGGAVAAWTAGSGEAWTIRGARLARLAGPWAPIPRLAVTGTRPALATGGARIVVAAWTGPDGAVHAARQRTGATSWDGSTPISAPGATAPGAAIAPSGLAAVSWQRPGGVEVALRAPSGPAWSAPLAMGSNAGALAPVRVDWGTPVAVNGRGDVVVAWLDAPEAGQTTLPARVAVRRAGAVSAPATLDRIVFANEPGTVAIDRAGVAFAGWVQRRGGPDVTARFAVRRESGWSTPRELGGGGSPLQPLLAVAPGGSAIAIAGAYVGRSPVVVAYEAPSPARLRTSVSGPTSARAGSPLTWRVLVRNVGGTAARGVILRGRVEGPVTVGATPPPTSRAGEALRWSLGAIGPRASRVVVLRGRAPARYDGRLRLSFSATSAVAPVTVGGASG
jgi:hypothetical protein